MSEVTAPLWIVNEMGELGVKIGDHCFFLYKGESVEYNPTYDDNGVTKEHKYRKVGKREFGEVQHPRDYYDKDGASQYRNGYDAGVDLEGSPGWNTYKDETKEAFREIYAWKPMPQRVKDPE